MEKAIYGLWEGNDNKALLNLLIGNNYGPNPEAKIDEIRGDRITRTDDLCKMLEYDKNFIVLEIGSGMGFGSRQIAQVVGHLYCGDISDTFLRAASEECSSIKNISFFKINEKNPTLDFSESFFDAVFSDAVFIHLNLFDIFWYFHEFKKVVKEGGQVWITIGDATNIIMESFKEVADLYKENKTSLPNLLSWNSPEGVISIAAYFGFVFEFVMDDGPNIGLKFLKTS